jgi:hypothetical protein
MKCKFKERDRKKKIMGIILKNYNAMGHYISYTE